jgi:hypothetical protein
VRDPLFPIVLVLIVLLGVWLGILGPLPDSFSAWLQKWQTLVAAIAGSSIASIAAYVAFSNTSRSLKHAQQLEDRRRSRKHAALRSVLPVTLADVSRYAERSVRNLNELASNCVGEALPKMLAPSDLAAPLPSETLGTLAAFIEYSDFNVGVIEGTLSLIQIHDSRVRTLVENNHNTDGINIVVRANIEASVIDAASIYAGAGAVFDYARRRQETLPAILTWDNVENALGNLRVFADEYPRLYELLNRRRSLSAGPFERLRAQ